MNETAAAVGHATEWQMHYLLRKGANPPDGLTQKDAEVAIERMIAREHFIEQSEIVCSALLNSLTNNNDNSIGDLMQVVGWPSYRFVSVIDGGVLRCKFGFLSGDGFNIRMIGVQPGDNSVTNLLNIINVAGYPEKVDLTVIIDPAVDLFDTDGYVLAHVFVQILNDMVYVNRLQIASGLARVSDPAADHLGITALRSAENYARENGKGHWGTGVWK